MDYKIPFPKSILQRYYLWPFVFLIVSSIAPGYIWIRGRTSAQHRIMLFGLLWFLVAIFPYMHIVYVLNAPISEHWLYIPAIGIALFISYLIFYSSSKIAWVRVTSGFACVVIILIYSYMTREQNKIWANDITLYENIVRYSPYSEKAYYNLAMKYLDRGDLLRARRFFKRVLKINRDNEIASENIKIIDENLKRSKAQTR